MSLPSGIESFVALDVETANTFRGSICEIGLVRFEGQQVVARYSRLIRPHSDYADFEFTNIHGISASDVLDAPSLVEVWDEIWGFIGEGPFLAHNASFDVGALFDASGHLNLKIPRTSFYCSLVLARRVLGLPGNKLSELAALFNIKQRSAHRAEDDALVAGTIATNLMLATSTNSIGELASKHGVAPGVLDSHTNIGSKVRSAFSDHETSLRRTSPPGLRGVHTASESDGNAIARDLLLVWVNEIPRGLLNPEGTFHGHEVYFHNTEGQFTAWQGQQLVALEGGLSSTKVTKFTSIVVCSPSEEGEFIESGLRVETPLSFLRLTNRLLEDLPSLPKPVRTGTSNGAWFRV
jgi:DNA polymerase III epsilon subunit-like protein